MEKAKHILKVEGLRIGFNGQRVLNNIDLTMLEGEQLAILGRSGSGKSVMLKCLIRLLEPDAGQVEILNENVMDLSRTALNALRQEVGFVFQGGAIYDSMTVEENLFFPLLRQKKSRTEEEYNELVKSMLKNVGLENSEDKYPSELSGGMKKRVALARNLVLQPKIIFYDEPTAGLDPVTAHEITMLIREMRDMYNTSSLLITHDIISVSKIADRVMMIKDGEVYAEGTLEELTQSDDSWIREYFKRTVKNEKAKYK